MQFTLNFLETFIYFSVWISVSLYSIYKFYLAQNEMLIQTDAINNLEDLQEGWFVNRLQDVSDIEWTTWKYFIKSSIAYLLINSIVSELIRNSTLKHNIIVLKLWYILSTLIFIANNFHISQIITICVQPAICAAIIFCGGGKLTIWIASIAFLISFNFIKYEEYIWHYLNHDSLQDEEIYLLLFAVPWTALRCIIYCIDYIEKQDKFKDIENYKGKVTSVYINLLNMFSYILYFPVLYTGPVILYEDFERSFYEKPHPLRLRLQEFLWDLMLFFIYSIILDLTLHYIYFYAMKSNMQLIRMLPSLPLCGGGFWMGVQFHLKYVITYGTTCAFSRLDNIDAPPTPRCIARIHVYSQMWKYFDVALYKFLVKYVYRPTIQCLPGQSTMPDVLKKLFGSLVTFIFTYLWHGHEESIMIWAILNYIGICFEQVGGEISKMEIYKYFRNDILQTTSMEQRFVALVCTPLLALSAVANFYLFAGRRVGDLFFKRFIPPSGWDYLLFVPLYCCCHVSIALKHVPSRTYRRKTSKEHF